MEELLTEACAVWDCGPHTRLLQPPAALLFILQSWWIMHVHLETT